MRTFALAIAATLLLASCADDPKPIEPKSSASPKPTSPTLPPEATKDTPQAQVAFVRHVVATLTYAVNSGETEELEALFDPKCNGCANYLQRVHSDNAGNGHVDGFKWTVISGEVLEGNSVEVMIDAAEYRKVSSAGKTSRVNAARYKLGFKLTGSNGDRLVRELYVPGSDND